MKRRALLAAPMALLFGGKAPSKLHYLIDSHGVRAALSGHDKRIAEHQARIGVYQFIARRLERAGLVAVPGANDRVIHSADGITWTQSRPT